MCSGAELRMDTAGYDLGKRRQRRIYVEVKEMLSFGVKGDVRSGVRGDVEFRSRRRCEVWGQRRC